MVLVVEANVRTQSSVRRSRFLARKKLLRRWSLLRIPKQGSGVGAGVRRLNNRQAMLLVAEPRDGAKEANGFRRYFRGPVSHRAARLRTGSEPGVSLLTAS
jgi:hypothetical protein